MSTGRPEVGDFAVAGRDNGGVTSEDHGRRRAPAEAGAGERDPRDPGLLALGYGVVNIATQKPGKNQVRLEGICEAQQLFGGVPQEGDRLGSADAPVTVQVFNDLQARRCREDFLRRSRR